MLSSLNHKSGKCGVQPKARSRRFFRDQVFHLFAHKDRKTQRKPVDYGSHSEMDQNLQASYMNRRVFSRTKTLISLSVIASVLVTLSLSGAVAAMPVPHIRSLAPNVLAGPGTSLQWSGYAVTGPVGSVSDVKGSWKVPAIVGACPTRNQYSSFWVGIDGVSSSTVEQIGTDSVCQNGSPVYYAWYEFYPFRNYDIFYVNPDDTISAEVSYSNGTFTVSIVDVTSGKSFSTSGRVRSAQRLSAEWIAEAPSSRRISLPLADFGTAYFGFDNTGINSTCYATVSGATGTIASFASSVQQITMVTPSGTTKAQPSSLSSDGTSFSIEWTTVTQTTTTTFVTQTLTSSSSSTSTSQTLTSTTNTATTAETTVVSSTTLTTIVGLEMQVVSNSSVSNLVFDSARGFLNFTVSGPSGSYGFFNATIAKSLLSGQPIVFIDGVQSPASVSQDANFWYVRVTYMHSEHHVVIGGSNVIPEFPSAAALLVLLMLVMLAIRRRNQVF